ncbi:MAG: cyclic nucleotide-binding domain-containing protein [Syntrophales bacterium]
MFEMKFFKKGDLIIEDGSTEEDAYLIQKGSVEVFKMEKGRRIVLAKLGVGNVIGEMCLLTGEAHSASVVALEDTGVNTISREDFEMMLNTNPKSIIPILKEAFRKLIHMNRLAVAFEEKGYTETEAPAPDVETKKVLVLRALTADAERALQGREIEISKSPFSIGRSAKDGTFDTVDLKLMDKEPYQLSRTHCVIALVKDKHYLIDTASTLGTTLDGVRVGKREIRKNALLEKGKHTLILGVPTSPYKFELDIPG